MYQEAPIREICLLPKAASLQELCDLTYRILGNPVFVSDLAHTILAYTRDVAIPDTFWQTNVIEGQLIRNTLKQNREVATVHESSTASHRPVLVEDDFLPYPRYIKALVVRGIPVGVMVVTAYTKPFGPNDRELMDLISSFMVSVIEKDRYFLSGEKTIENYFMQLLERASASRERVEQHLEALDYTISPCTYVLTIAMDDEGGTAPMPELLELFALLPGCHTFLFNTTLVCVCGSHEPICHWEEEAPALRALLSGERLFAGVSRRVENIADLREYYQQARKALEAGIRLGRRDSRFFCYDELTSFLLLGEISGEKLMHYCHDSIRRLYEYDLAHDTELCTTLQVYLEQARSLARAAERLYIHRNTVRYRIGRCMEITGSDLRDGNEIFSFILSLHILEYRKKFLSSERSIL